MSTLITQAPANHSTDDEYAGPSLIDLLTWIGRGKRFIAVTTCLAAAAAVVTALTLPPRYTARITMLPPVSQQQGGGSGAALAALGQLGGLGGGLGGKTPDELYAALLGSDSVIRSLDERHNLREHYNVKAFTHLRKVVPQHARVSSDRKSGVIAVEVEDNDPQFAADLANAHFRALSDLLSRLAVSEAKQRRLFFEQQLKDTKERLIQAEQDFKKMQESSGVIVLDKQAESLISGAAALRTQIAAREVQMKVLRTSATEQNPEVVRLSSELQALRSELARVESNAASTPLRNGGASISDMPVGRIPEATIEFVRAKRDLKLQEMLLEGMVRQYEIAKLDEAKEGPALQQIDVATPPDAKSKPARAPIAMGGTLAGLILSCLWIIGRGALSQGSPSPEGARALQDLRAAWRWKKA